MLTDAQQKAKTNSLVVYKQQYGPGYCVVRPKTKKKKRSYNAVFPSGIDDGKGAERLMQTYVEETLSAEQPKQHMTVDWKVITDDFRSSTFLEQVKHLEMNNVPLLSQIAKQKALLPQHTTEKKKRLIDLSDRLKRDDSNLVRIRLDNEGVDDVTLVHLTLALPKNTHLQHLMLHNNAITDDGVNILCLALRWHPNFHCLWIGANRITDIGAKHISTLLHRNNRIKEINVSNRWPVNYWQTTEIDLHPHITYIGAEYVSDQLKKGCGLTRLSLADQRIRDDGAMHLFNALSHCELRSLNIAGNELTDRCCSVLGAVLAANPLLQMLSLAHNGVGDEGAKAIAKGIARNCELQAIDLSNNMIDALGLEALYLSLSHNDTLKTLVTINNKCDDPRAEDKAAARNRSYNVFRYGNRPNTGEEEQYTAGHLHNAKRDANFHNHLRDLFVSSEERDYFYQPGGEVQEYGQVVSDSEHYNDYSRLDVMSRGGGFRGRSGSVSRQSVSAGSGSSAGGVWPPRVGTAGSTSSGGTREGLTSPWRRPSVDLQVEPLNVGVLGKSVLSRSYRNLFDTGEGGVSGLGSRGGSPDKMTSRRGSALGGSGGGVGLGLTSSSPHRLHSMAGSVSAGGQTPQQMRLFSAHSTDDEDHASIAEAVRRVTDHLPTSNQGVIPHADLSRSNSTIARTITTPGGGNKRRSFLTTLQSLSVAPAEPPPGVGATLLTSKSSTKASLSEPAGGKKQPYRNSFQGSADTGRPSSRSATPNFPPAEVHSLAHVKKSSELGKTVGIPDIKNIGIMPVRTSISSDKDSTQHFLYLRVATTADGIHDRPTSILQIAKDRENEIKKLKASRQTAQYKADKKYLLETVSKVVVHKAAEPKVPDKFWEDWRIKNRLQYIDGVDQSEGCTSTLLEMAGGGRAKHRHRSKRTNKHAPLPAIAAPEAPVSAYDLVILKQDPKLSYQRHLQAKKANATPGEILAARRKEITIKKMALKEEQQMISERASVN